MLKDKDLYRLVFNWIASAFLPDGAASQIWRALIVAFSLIDLVLFGAWQRGQIGAFMGEWGQIYGKALLSQKKVNDLSITIYGPTILVETAHSHATVSVRNDGTETLRDISLALVSQDGMIRVSGGAPAPNSLYVAQLSPGIVHEQPFTLTTTRASSTVTPTLDLEVSYNSGGSVPKVVGPQRITGICTFKMSKFTDVYSTMAQWLRVVEGIASILERISAVLQVFVVVLGGLVVAIAALLIKPPRDWINRLINWINKANVSKRQQE